MNKRTATNILSLRTSAISCLMALSLGNSFAQGITFQTDASTGAIAQLAIDNDAQKMNWVLTPDGKQYKWVTGKYGWGLGFMTVNGQKLEWQTPISQKGEPVYQAGDIRISVNRTLKNGELF